MPKFGDIGTIDKHTSLSDLAYADSGHTGFAAALNSGPILFPAYSRINLGGDANWGWFRKITLPAVITNPTFYIPVYTAGGAGAVVRIALYDSAGALIEQSADIDGTSAGWKSFQHTGTVSEGVYWIGASTNNATLRFGGENAGVNIPTDLHGYNISAYPLPASVPALTEANDTMTMFVI